MIRSYVSSHFGRRDGGAILCTAGGIISAPAAFLVLPNVLIELVTVRYITLELSLISLEAESIEQQY